MTITKVIPNQDTVSGAAYINPNSLVISDIQRVDSPDQDRDQLAPSGVLQDRFDNPRYYTGDAVT